VDRAVRKHLSSRQWVAAIVTGDAGEVRRRLLSGEPTPIVYDTQGTPPEVLQEDARIESYTLPVSERATTVVPVDAMFAGRLR
jgi:hypothetical protein